MSEQINLDVQAVLNTESLYAQLSQIRPRISVDVDTSHISSQIQAAVAQASASVVPITIPTIPMGSSGVSSSGGLQMEDQSSGLQKFASAGMGALNTTSQLIGSYTALERIGSKLKLPTLSGSLD